MTEHKDTDLAWAAGFLDGEGYFGIQRNKRVGHDQLWIVVTAPQVDPLPLLKLRSLFGGAIYHRQSKSIASADQYDWHISNRLAARMLHLLFPYFVLKGPRVDLLLEFDALLLRKGKRRLTDREIAKRDEIANAIKALNRKGVSKPMPEGEVWSKPRPRKPSQQLRLVQ